jgi:hypothetical protein
VVTQRNACRTLGRLTFSEEHLMHRVLAAGLCGLVLIGTSAGTSVANAAAAPSGPVASRSASTTSELPRTAVSSINVGQGVLTLVDGRRLRYGGDAPITLALAYMSPDNVQFTTTVTTLAPTPAWYATVEGTYHRHTRKADALRLTLVAEPTPQAKARCSMATGAEAGSPCTRPEGTSSPTWTGVKGRG